MKLLLITLLATLALTSMASADEFSLDLNEGWNLVHGFYEIDQITSGSITAKDILAIYAFLPEEQQFVELYPNTDSARVQKLYREDLDVMGAFWVYSKKEGSMTYVADKPRPIREIELRKGWNLIGITESFRGYALQDVFGSCTIEKGYAFLNGKWKSVDEFKGNKDFISVLTPTFKDGSSTNYRFRGIALKVSRDCELAPPPQPAPSIPTFPVFPEESKASVAPTADNDPVLGNSNAKVTMIAFDDYEGPFDARFYRETFPLIKKAYIDTGKVKYVVRDFPLGIYENSMPAAVTGVCITAYGSQGDFWKFHDAVFQNQALLSVSYLKKLAREILAYDDEIDWCVDSQVYKTEVENDRRDAIAAGVIGTPTFFINGKRIDGAQPYIVFKEALDSAVAAAYV